MKQLLDPDRFLQQLAASKAPFPVFKQTLREGDEIIKRRFDSDEPITNLVTLRARLADFLLEHAWRQMVPENSRIALAAVGGYGRGELHPYSDIDLLILLRSGETPQELIDGIEQFLRFLWDLGLEVGHSVRTLAECEQEADGDLTIITNLMESRFLIGHQALFDSMRRSITPDRMWSSNRFFEAKVAEQHKRHSRGDLASNLEPNIKECPGGLRDIQTIGWVLKRHFGGDNLHDLVARGFINEAEYRALMDGQEFLWKIRFALHILARRHEDRLLFDHQRTLASWFGYSDEDHSLAVEKFMQLFYRNVSQLRMLNERLLQLFDEVILREGQEEQIEPLNRRFRARNGYIELIDEKTFRRTPFALLEIFLLQQQHPHLKGIRASTIRRIRLDRQAVDRRFRNDLRARSLFMEILRQSHHVDLALRRMNRYGILGLYIPAWGKIVGRMQFDLFHMYTVDEHTLNLVHNLQRFALSEYDQEFPLCSRVMRRIPKRELLFLAGLFHDIAKGRGGDHSTLGSADALVFCRNHGLAKRDGELVAWLVENHLLMSMITQRQDIHDPEVVHAFADRAGNVTRLDYLYLLTVADVRATDPNKWNSWKDSLLRELYISTKEALLRGLENPQRVEELTRNQQHKTLDLLKQRGIDEEAAQRLWHGLDNSYFLNFSPEGLAWHVQQFLDVSDGQLPIVRVRRHTAMGGSEVLILSRDRDLLFADSTCVLDQLQLNVVSAHIETTTDGLTLDSFKVLEADGDAIADLRREQEVIDTLQPILAGSERPRYCLNRRIPRQLKHFRIPSRIDYCRDPAGLHTIVKLVTADRPGLLAIIGDIFVDCGIQLHRAKIATIGAEAEDTFFVTDHQGRLLERREQFDCLQREIFRRIDHEEH